MDVILLPGLCLDASSWDEVVPHLEAAGHRHHAVTLPGVGEVDGDRAAVTLADQVAAVVELIDSVAAPVAIVAHSASGGIAHSAVDARPDRVVRVFYVGGFPTGDGDPLVDAFTPHDGAITFPDWSEFDDTDLADLGDAGRTRLRDNAVPSPECAARDPLRLTDGRRYDVPVTAVCPEYRSEMLRQWIADGRRPVREFAQMKHVEFV